jgi:hypothetical protein
MNNPGKDAVVVDNLWHVSEDGSNSTADIVQPEPETKKVRIRLTQERMEGVKVGVWRKAKNNDMDAMIEMLSSFVVGPTGLWLPHDEAVDYLDNLTFKQLGETVAQVGEMAEEIAAPKAPESR